MIEERIGMEKEKMIDLSSASLDEVCHFSSQTFHFKETASLWCIVFTDLLGGITVKPAGGLFSQNWIL